MFFIFILFVKKVMKIHVSENNKSLLKSTKYSMTERGKIQIKGKGEMKTYFVLARLDERGHEIKAKYEETLKEWKKNNADVPEAVVEVMDKHAGFSAIDSSDTD